MEVSTTIAGMIRGNQIVVPDYQRAYSPPYYFGHLLYEKTGETAYAVIDGQ